MNKVFDLNAVPERRLSVRHKIHVDPYMNFNDAIHVAKCQMAQQLAQMILDSKDFFWERGDTVAGYSFLECGVDCVVVTASELREIRDQSFKEGVRHVSGFMRVT